MNHGGTRTVAGMMGVSRVTGLTAAAFAWALAMLSVKIIGSYNGFADLLLDACTGGALLVSGAWAVRSRADRRVGWVLLLASVCWFAEDLNSAAQPGLLLLGRFAAYASVPALAWLALTFPSGRLTRPAERAILVALGVIALLVLPVHDLLYWESTGCCSELGVTLPTLDYSGLARAWALCSYAAAAVIAVAVAVRLVLRWRTATPPTRRLIAPFFASSAVLIALNLVDLAWRSFGGIVPTDPLTEGEAIATLAVALSLPIGLLRLRLARHGIVDAALRIGDAAPQTVIAQALDDPHARLVIGAEPMTARPGRAVTTLWAHGAVIATLEHDETWAEDPSILDALGRVLGLDLENRRLKESRAVLVRTADEQRRRLERDLHDGAQQRLVALSLLLARLREDATNTPRLATGLEHAQDILRDASDDLRAFARGARPSPLLLHGLVGAVRQLVHDAPLPVEVEGGVSRSLPEREAAAYFVVCEALANAGRHSAATRCRVRLRLHAGQLRVEISDDGTGGVRVRTGGGLEGLRNRVEALGGDFDVRDGVTGGAVVRAALPWPPAAVASPHLRIAG
jgi:signal transduction histidine kinase